MSTLIYLQEIYRRFCQESLQSGAIQANSAPYAKLAKALFARFYGKLFYRGGSQEKISFPPLEFLLLPAPRT